MIAQASEETIELRVDDIAQLFHTLDPFPFRERDLDREAEEYIVGWARELSVRQAIRIRVHHPNTDAQAKAALELREAFDHYFADRANATQRDINELFRIGRWSLAIGLAILITCLLFAHVVVGALFANPLRRLLEESLLILGWVANWRRVRNGGQGWRCWHGVCIGWENHPAKQHEEGITPANVIQPETKSTISARSRRSRSLWTKP